MYHVGLFHWSFLMYVGLFHSPLLYYLKSTKETYIRPAKPVLILISYIADLEAGWYVGFPPPTRPVFLEASRGSKKRFWKSRLFCMCIRIYVHVFIYIYLYTYILTCTGMRFWKSELFSYGVHSLSLFLSCIANIAAGWLWRKSCPDQWENRSDASRWRNPKDSLLHCRRARRRDDGACCPGRRCRGCADWCMSRTLYHVVRCQLVLWGGCDW